MESSDYTEEIKEQLTVTPTPNQQINDYQQSTIDSEPEIKNYFNTRNDETASKHRL